MLLITNLQAISDCNWTVCAERASCLMKEIDLMKCHTNTAMAAMTITCHCLHALSLLQMWIFSGLCVYVCVCMCMCLCMCLCVHICVCVYCISLGSCTLVILSEAGEVGTMVPTRMLNAFAHFENILYYKKCVLGMTGHTVQTHMGLTYMCSGRLCWYSLWFTWEEEIIEESMNTLRCQQTLT